MTKEQWFNKRTKNHINLVNKWYNILITKFPEIERLPDRLEFHDASKFKEPEYSPYVEIAWSYHMKNLGKDYEVSQDLKDAMNEATIHHIMTNPHHPEFWDEDFDPYQGFNRENRDAVPDKIVDATSMPEKYVIEMMADWLAMSEEKNTNPYDWYEMNVGKRWQFIQRQKDIMKKCLKIWEKNK